MAVSIDDVRITNSEFGIFVEKRSGLKWFTLQAIQAGFNGLCELNYSQEFPNKIYLSQSEIKKRAKMIIDEKNNYPEITLKKDTILWGNPKRKRSIYTSGVIDELVNYYLPKVETPNSLKREAKNAFLSKNELLKYLYSKNSIDDDAETISTHITRHEKIIYDNLSKVNNIYENEIGNLEENTHNIMEKLKLVKGLLDSGDSETASLIIDNMI